jgi:quercetin dioxygenase-like cupin family protein
VKVTHAAQAPRYDAPGHFGVSACRLQGHEASSSEDFWVGLSVYEPGGTAEWSMGDTEKVYIVLEGELTVTDSEGVKHILRKHDSCLIPPFENREVRNNTEYNATLVVISTYNR